MNTNLLKLFAGHIIVISEMDTGTKEQLLNFVEDATEYQVKSFLLDAEIVKDRKSEIANHILNNRFEISAIPVKINEFKNELESQ
jgi:hypothetical protein